MQVRRDDGPGFHQGCLEMRLVFDPGTYIRHVRAVVGLGMPGSKVFTVHFSDFSETNQPFALQNDLVHAWGLDLNFHRCVDVSFSSR